MNRSPFLALLFSFLLVALVLSFAHATGIGGYLSGARGEGDDGADTRHLGGGLTLDTGVGTDRSLSYRLALGYDRLTLEDGYGEKETSDAIVGDHLLGIKLHETGGARIWIGPALMAGWCAGDRAEGLALGVGGSVGADLPLGETLFLSLSAGWRTALYIFGLADDHERFRGLNLTLYWKERPRR